MDCVSCSAQPLTRQGVSVGENDLPESMSTMELVQSTFASACRYMELSLVVCVP